MGKFSLLGNTEGLSVLGGLNEVPSPLRCWGVLGEIPTASSLYCCLHFFAYYLLLCLLLFPFPWVPLVKNHVFITSPGGGKSVYQTGKISKALVENKGCRTGASRSGLCPGSAPVTCSDGKPTSTSLCWGRLLPRAALSLGRRCEWFP